MNKQTGGDWISQKSLADANAKRERAEHDLQTPLIKRLSEGARHNPAAATVFAQELLLEWRAGQGETKLDEAKKLLVSAAEQGEPEASFILAMFDPPLCADEDRENHRIWAERCGHERALFKKDAQESKQEDYWLNELEEQARSATEKIEASRSQAESGDAEAQFELGQALRDKASLFREAGEDVDAKTFNEAADEARHWIKAAAKTLPKARHYLAMHWGHAPATKLDLLQSAAYPPEGGIYPPALCDLADALEVTNNFASAESCLHQGVEHQVPGAAFKLAMLLINHQQPGADISVSARQLLLQAAQNKSSWMYRHEAAFQAALMLVRGEGGSQDFELARDMFKLGVEQRRDRNDVTTFCATLALNLGWGNADAWELAVEQMVHRLKLNAFKAEPNLPLMGTDLAVLTSRNANLCEKDSIESMVKSSTSVFLESLPPQDIYGRTDSIEHLIKALFAILTSDQLMQDELHALLASPQSMLEHYLWGQLWLSGRLGKKNYTLATEHLKKADKLDNMLTETALVGPGRLRSNNFRLWLFRETVKSLLRIENEQKHKAELEAEERRFQLEIQEEKHQIEKQQAVIDEHARMLSYLTHTLNNTLSSGPESARQAMRILGSELYENNREYKAINNIASMFSTFLFAQQLLKTFKLYIAEPDALRQNWDVDVEGDASISVVLAMSLRQTLSQVVFDSNHQAALKRLLPHKDAGAVKAIRKDFMDVIVPLDVDASNSRLIFDWVQDHLGLIHLHVAPSAELHFRSNSTRYTFFFSIFSELIYNALKYSDGTQPIDITWEQDSQAIGGGILFRCVNTWTDESIQSSEGSGKGLVFLARLAEVLGAKFEKCIENNRFVAEIRFPENLLKGKA